MITLCAELRNINPISIIYASRPRLRSRLTLPGRAVCRNPWAYGDRDSHPIYRYSYQQQLLSYLHWCLRSSFTDLDNAPLPRKLSADNSHSQLRFYTSAPLRFRRNNPRPVSYYAFFKGWLLLSQPPGCLGIVTSFPTQCKIWDLSWRSGFFPF